MRGVERTTSATAPLSRPVNAKNPITLSALVFAASGLVARAEEPRYIDIGEYRIEGVHTLPSLEVEKTVYPYLGPSRTADDVEKARAALEKAYRDKGYQTVSVVIPAQKVEGGVVTLQVLEGKVGRLRVRGSQYTDLEVVKAGVPSLAEGKTPDFNAVQKEIVALNKSADAQITPTIRPGVEPGTVDVDLEVKDKPALHGSLELNNRYNPDTKPLRLNGEIHYDNLWQLGHSIGFSFQTAPERPEDSKVFSGYYIAKPVGCEGLGLMLTGTKQDSDVNTLGAFNVSGRGEDIGLRALIDLPSSENLFHSLSVGIDYKHFDTALSGGGSPAFSSPITYYPFSANYDLTRLYKDGSVTQAGLGLTWHLRGMGSDEAEFEAKRSGSSGGFAYFRGDLSHLQKLPEDFELFGKVQVQASADPLVSNEQFGIGGLTTVRGYLESEAVGDNALGLTGELRSPSFTLGGALDEWRVYGFADWAGATLNNPLPGQQSRFELASAGVGSRVKFLDHFVASADLGVPLLAGPRTDAGELRITFRLRAEF